MINIKTIYESNSFHNKSSAQLGAEQVYFNLANFYVYNIGSFVLFVNINFNKQISRINSIVGATGWSPTGTARCAPTARLLEKVDHLGRPCWGGSRTAPTTEFSDSSWPVEMFHNIDKIIPNKYNTH